MPPIGVIRGSSRSLKSRSHSARATGDVASSSASTRSASTRIVLNFRQGNIFPYRPTLWCANRTGRSEEHTSELQSLMRISYAVFCLKKKKETTNILSKNDILKDIKII